MGARRWQAAALWYARVALSAAFLPGIPSRFGWWGRGVGYGDFAHFEQYAAFSASAAALLLADHPGTA